MENGQASRSSSSSCCVDKWDPKKGKATRFSPGKRAFSTHALGCAVLDSSCSGATVKNFDQEQDGGTIQSLEGFAILGGGATKTVSGLISVGPVAGGETEAASRIICIPHSEFPQRIYVVSNEPTPFI